MVFCFRFDDVLLSEMDCRNFSRTKPTGIPFIALDHIEIVRYVIYAAHWMRIRASGILSTRR
jgi:hypothetical protein